MKRWMVALIFLLMFVPASSVRAQVSKEVVFDKVQVDIWPEYDRSGVLVIYRMTLAAATSLPAQVTLRVPISAEKPYNLAMQDVDGLLYNLDYTLTEEDGWATVKFTTPSAEFQMEYYDPGITRNGVARTFDYSWSGTASVNSLVLMVQQPRGATGMKIVPDMGSGVVGQDGLTYFTAIIGKVTSATPVNLRLSYNKADDSTSITAQGVAAQKPVTNQTPGRTASFQEVLPWILALIGVLLVAGGGFWYWQSGREQRSGAQQRHRHVHVSSENPDTDQVTAIYCHQCGKRAGAGDTFCRTCGSKLRI